LSIPKIFSRITKGGLHQIYQPGFNNYNSCWLSGKWLTLPKEEWEKVKDEHELMYKDIDLKQNNYRGHSTNINKMNAAQKKAWEYFSGETYFDCYNESNIKYCKHLSIAVQLSGKSISEKSLKWFRKEYLVNGFKIIKLTSSDGKSKDQTKGYNIPKDILLNNDTPIDVTQLVIDQNLSREYSIAEETFKNAPDDENDFMVQMAVYSIITMEESIIRSEWDAYNGKPDYYYNKKESAAKYAYLKKLGKEKLKKSFDKVYEKSRKSHNECARTNLDNCNGNIFCYVLPKFNDDGTFEPWGPKDIPWGHIKK